VNQAQRQIRIRGLLEEREFVDLESLCRELGTSESSVRRDLVRLPRPRERAQITPILRVFS
jgi:DeoR/GlpR family transcriptional regulator of sugar metabolism